MRHWASKSASETSRIGDIAKPPTRWIDAQIGEGGSNCVEQLLANHWRVSLSGGARPTTEYLYDNRGLVTGSRDPLGHDLL